MSSTVQPTHWADIAAENVIRTRARPDRDYFVCASGITPSGTVHIGNFREIISVDLVVRALRDRGAVVRFIYSWDDYDVFRKVPKNMPAQDELARFLRKPITAVPDPFGVHASYARANEAVVESLLPVVGIFPEYLYQAALYQASTYAEGIRLALQHREIIRAILNAHRTAPLPDDWWPIAVFSSFTDRDTTTILSWDGLYGLSYRCDETGQEDTVDLRTTGLVKLSWRVDWPMRWYFEGVDFEPAGKDHHSEGGSFDTAKRICSEVYGVEPPVTFQYDFISIKGRGGKISSSSGDVIGLDEVLEVYQPEVLRYLFAGTRPNTEFAISFDLDVIKIYEDYDRTERVYFGLEPVGEKRREKERRIYELSQIRASGRHDGTGPSACARDNEQAAAGSTAIPGQLPFRHLCNVLLIHDGDLDRAIAAIIGDPGSLNADVLDRMRRRAQCAWNWLKNYAPPDFCFSVKTATDTPTELSDNERVAVSDLYAAFEKESQEIDHARQSPDALDDKKLQELIYNIARSRDMEPTALFGCLYRVLIGRDRGPRLAGFLLTIGVQRVLSILAPYVAGDDTETHPAMR